MEYIYKLRNINALLGEFEELERQELFFAAPNELNDPQEGFLNLYWEGDDVVWTNLFRYYIRNVFRCLLIVEVEDAVLSPQMISFHTDFYAKSAFPDIEEKYLNIERKVFDTYPVQEVIDYLAMSHKRIFKDELYFIFNSLHLLILRTISIELEKFFPEIIVYSVLAKIPDVIGSGDNECSILTPGFLEILSVAELSEVAREHNIKALELSLRVHEKNKIRGVRAEYILREFQIDFIKRLSDLTYNDVYITCFVREYPNTSMWGYYGDGHKGCCLIFKVGHPEYLDDYTRSPDDSVIRVKRHGGSNYIDMKIDEVNYSSEYPELNFFQSVGNLPSDIYKRCWLTNNGKRSYYYEQRYNDKRKWHRDYYSKMHSIFCCKSEYWIGESEVRSILTTSPEITGTNDVQDRKVSYDFKSLAGIVFGVNTTYDDKCRVVDIIRKKCKLYNVSDFKIYQAYYNRYANKMDKVELKGAI